MLKTVQWFLMLVMTFGGFAAFSQPSVSELSSAPVITMNDEEEEEEEDGKEDDGEEGEEEEENHDH